MPRKPERNPETPVNVVTDASKKRGRPPKKSGPVLITTLQIGDSEYDISGFAEKAYKEYKSVHKRKVITCFHVYVKPEEDAVYYTVNGEYSPDFKIELSHSHFIGEDNDADSEDVHYLLVVLEDDII